MLFTSALPNVTKCPTPVSLVHQYSVCVCIYVLYMLYVHGMFFPEGQRCGIRENYSFSAYSMLFIRVWYPHPVWVPSLVILLYPYNTRKKILLFQVFIWENLRLESYHNNMKKNVWLKTFCIVKHFSSHYPTEYHIETYWYHHLIITRTRKSTIYINIYICYMLKWFLHSGCVNKRVGIIWIQHQVLH
jgi:hypothetical protein